MISKPQKGVSLIEFILALAVITILLGQSLTMFRRIVDDANIEKFNKIIKKFSKDSQFVIITHNKQTMAEVDTIYGVYMEEQGVSAVTAVDFRDLEHTSILEAVG